MLLEFVAARGVSKGSVARDPSEAGVRGEGRFLVKEVNPILNQETHLGLGFQSFELGHRFSSENLLLGTVSGASGDRVSRSNTCFSVHLGFHF